MYFVDPPPEGIVDPLFDPVMSRVYLLYVATNLSPMANGIFYMRFPDMPKFD